MSKHANDKTEVKAWTRGDNINIGIEWLRDKVLQLHTFLANQPVIMLVNV
jgi:hypothetical protein